VKFYESNNQEKVSLRKCAFYPVCENAQKFCKLTNKKTLDHRDIELIRSLGFEVSLEQETI